MKHHASETELLLCCFKVDHAELGVTYKEALDEALCFGWIDGVRRNLDARSFSVRFTPRKPRSRWSLVNTRRAEELVAAGRMHAAGLAAFEARDPEDSRRYSFEARPVELDPALAKKFRAAKAAWAAWLAKPPGYRRTAQHWVMSAKQPATRERRLAELIAATERGGTPKVLTPRKASRRG
ncbi:MAG: YdeI/OmpD-associated family protein [Planctomycetes bacterium]|nr:YdeI/OmpD-associated family protein [Planctomycetota bacterium]